MSYRSYVFIIATHTRLSRDTAEVCVYIKKFKMIAVLMSVGDFCNCDGFWECIELVTRHLVCSARFCLARKWDLGPEVLLNVCCVVVGRFSQVEGYQIVFSCVPLDNSSSVWKCFWRKLRIWFVFGGVQLKISVIFLDVSVEGAASDFSL